MLGAAINWAIFAISFYHYFRRFAAPRPRRRFYRCPDRFFHYQGHRHLLRRFYDDDVSARHWPPSVVRRVSRLACCRAASITFLDLDVTHWLQPICLSSSRGPRAARRYSHRSPISSPAFLMKLLYIFIKIIYRRRRADLRHYQLLIFSAMPEVTTSRRYTTRVLHSESMPKSARLFYRPGQASRYLEP